MRKEKKSLVIGYFANDTNIQNIFIHWLSLFDLHIVFITFHINICSQLITYFQFAKGKKCLFLDKIHSKIFKKHFCINKNNKSQSSNNTSQQQYGGVNWRPLPLLFWNPLCGALAELRFLDLVQSSVGSFSNHFHFFQLIELWTKHKYKEDSGK